MSQTNIGLTRLQIMNEGLGRAGRPDLLSEARLWLNLFLEKQYLSQDYEWLLKNVDNRLCVNGDTLPSDYIRMKTITVTSNRLPVKLVEADEYEWLRRGYGFDQTTSQQNGTPNWAYIDQNANLIYFLPVPPSSNSVYYNYFYYSFPTLPDPTSSSGDSQVPKWGETTDILIQAIFARALQWLDDDRAPVEINNVKALLTDSRINSRDLRAGSPRFKLGKCHRRGRF